MGEFRRDEFRRRMGEAYERERRGHEFFRRREEEEREERERFLFGLLAADEFRHAQILFPFVFAPLAVAQEKVESHQATRADFEAAIQGELEAIAGYAELARMAPTIAERMMFIPIIGDEYGHLRILMSMEQAFCR
jgi:hypothetical protein